MKPRVRVLLVAIVIALAAVAVWRVFFAGSPMPENVIALSGRIEGDDSALASKSAGRIREIRVREGDTVGRGQIVAVLDDAQAQAAVADARARVAAARREIAVLQAQLRQSQLSAEQSAPDVQGRVDQAQAQLAAAQAQIAQQQAAYGLAATTAQRDLALYKTGDVSAQQKDQAVSAQHQAAAVLGAAQQQAQSAQGALTAARAGLSNPSIRAQQTAAVQAQISQQQSAIAAALAQLASAQANLADLTVRAPFTGTVMVRAAEPGEVVAPGTTLLTLLNLNKVYLRGFVPEDEIGKVALGQSARVYLDSDPSHALDAYVMRIDPQAMFTPENTYFRNDRVKEVFGVKLALKSGFGYAKPGMPADAEILTGGTWPK